ncbi:MAG: hypothetical protein QXD03_03910 [Candidatus Anstonellales archaeon]
MDREQLKNIIYQYKNEGLSFGDISKKLEEEYGIKRSRQSVYNLYNSKLKDLEGGIKEYDEKFVRDLIVGYRQVGLSFTDIVNELKDNYDIMKTRDVVYSIYKKAVGKYEDLDILPIKNDIVILFVLGYKLTEILDILNNKEQYKDRDIGYKFIRDVVLYSVDSIKFARDVYKNRIKKMLSDGYTVQDIIDNIKYKGVNIKDKAVKNFIGEIYFDDIKSIVNDKIDEIYRITGDTEVVKNVKEKVNDMYM